MGICVCFYVCLFFMNVFLCKLKTVVLQRAAVDTWLAGAPGELSEGRSAGESGETERRRHLSWRRSEQGRTNEVFFLWHFVICCLSFTTHFFQLLPLSHLHILSRTCVLLVKVPCLWHWCNLWRHGLLCYLKAENEYHAAWLSNK